MKGPKNARYEIWDLIRQISPHTPSQLLESDNLSKEWHRSACCACRSVYRRSGIHHFQFHFWKPCLWMLWQIAYRLSFGNIRASLSPKHVQCGMNRLPTWWCGQKNWPWWSFRTVIRKQHRAGCTECEFSMRPVVEAAELFLNRECIWLFFRPCWLNAISWGIAHTNCPMSLSLQWPWWKWRDHTSCTKSIWRYPWTRLSRMQRARYDVAWQFN